VVVNLRPHPMITREGADLHCEMPISFGTAALGGELEIPTLDGHAVTSRCRRDRNRARCSACSNKGIRPVRGSVHRRPLLPRRRRDAGQAHGAPERDSCASSSRSTTRTRAHSPRAKSFFDKVREFFGP
jgi:molecular chaperone DnaJ